MTLLKLQNGSFHPTIAPAVPEIAIADWIAAPDAISAKAALVIPNDFAVDAITNDLSQFEIIILELPNFKDGRVFSQARLLRDRFGFKGEVRARGEILWDQISYLMRCGVDAFEASGPNGANVNAALTEFTYAYQTSADNRSPIWRLRLQRAAEAA